MLHRLWLKITQEPGLANVHHHDILTEALTRFARDYGAEDREGIVQELRLHADADPMTIRRIADQIPTVRSEPTRSDSDGGHGDDTSSNRKIDGSRIGFANGAPGPCYIERVHFSLDRGGRTMESY